MNASDKLSDADKFDLQQCPIRLESGLEAIRESRIACISSEWSGHSMAARDADYAACGHFASVAKSRSYGLNRGGGFSEIEGKAASERGQRTSFNKPRGKTGRSSRLSMYWPANCRALSSNNASSPRSATRVTGVCSFAVTSPNGANGMNTPCWEAGGWTALVGGNPTERIGRSRVNDMAGKVTRVGASERGQRTSFNRGKGFPR